MAGFLALVGAVVGVVPAPAKASDFFDRTSIVDVHAGGGLSDAARSLGNGGYQLSNGTPVNFADWYTADMPAIHATWMTQVSDTVGLYWGFGTGEQGEKYEIEPEVRLGFVWLRPVAKRSAVSVSATATFGGMLIEKPCTADYGAIGGVQQVNCRLAASTMRPADTLDYLLNESPPYQTQLTLSFEHRF